MNKTKTPLEFSAHFFLTTYCNAFCPHCLMSAGPHQPKNFMKTSDVLFYLDQFDQDPNFRRSVGFNGGEVMTAYKYHSKDYIPNLLQECVNRNYEIDLRTNSLWTEDNTVNSVIWSSLDNLDFSKYTNKIQFSLSIDKFHNNETANQKLISRICKSDWANAVQFTAFLIPDCPNQDGNNKEIYARLFKLLSLLSDDGVKLSRMDISKISSRYNIGLYVNNLPFLIETHNFGKWGRAREFGIGMDETEDKYIANQFNVIHNTKYSKQLNTNNCIKRQHKSINIVFTLDNGGMADFIAPVEKATEGVLYHNGEKCKPWAELYPQLVENLRTRFNVLRDKYPSLTPQSVALPHLLRTLKLQK